VCKETYPAVPVSAAELLVMTILNGLDLILELAQRGLRCLPVSGASIHWLHYLQALVGTMRHKIHGDLAGRHVGAGARGMLSGDAGLQETAPSLALAAYPWGCYHKTIAQISEYANLVLTASGCRTYQQ
jgi:hypothetical protein